MRSALVILLFIRVAACANPIVIGPPARAYTYIDSENLAVYISRTDAVVRATFTLGVQTAGAPVWQRPAPFTVELPIWVPEKGAGNAAMASFWEVFHPGECNRLTNSAARRVFESTIGLRVLIGARTLDLASDISDFGGLRNRTGVDEPGFYCLWVTFLAGEELIWKGTPMEISYRQPLLCTNGESRFFYLPLFEHLPRDVSTADTRRYSITVFATGCAVAVDTTGESRLVEDGQSITLAPKAGQPIRARHAARPDKNGAANRSQPVSSEPNRASSAAGSGG